MPTASATGKATVHRLIGLGLLLVGLTYPFIVYLGMGHLSPRLFALMLGLVSLSMAVQKLAA